MQWTTPKKIAIALTLALVVPVFVLFALMFLCFEIRITILQIISILASLILIVYFISYSFLKKYIHERVKVIYKTLTRQRGVSDDLETDLNKVDEDVDK